MKRPRVMSSVAMALVFVVGLANLYGQNKQPLALVQTIPIPDVKGRLDHLWVDVGGKRLFVAGLENGSVEVVDLKAAKWLRTMPGFQKPQGILFVPHLNKLFVASGDDGMLRVYSGASLHLLDSVKLDIGPNRVAYDARRRLLYVGYGGKDAGKDYGEIAILDASTDKVVATVRVAAHPSELLLGNAGQSLFVLVSVRNEVETIDTRSRKVTATWPVSSEHPGDAALDEPLHRLLIGTHTPPKMVAMDSKDGKEVASLPTVDGMDGVYYDATHKRVYVSGGRGFDDGAVFVYQQESADRYEIIGKVSTKPGAGTSFWSPELNRYYVAAPAHNGQQASILVFEPQP
jgi:DNA-binding beta-propeller fold protein YncE